MRWRKEALTRAYCTSLHACVHACVRAWRRLTRPTAALSFFGSTSVTSDSWPLMVASATGHPGVVLVSFNSLLAPR
jgi:hypothetical protein